MKNLKNHTLLYDKDCPMCCVYSNAFIKSGMLDKNGRENFADMSTQNSRIIDFDRAKNEIALIDHNTNKVAYGLDSLLLIIGNSFPFLEKVGRTKPVFWFFSKMYSVVSYNRKIIVPSGKLITEKSCIPRFNVKYRIFYIVFATFLSSFILSSFLMKHFTGNLFFEKIILIFISLICWQTLIMLKNSKEKIFDYIGNLVTVLLISTLFLIPFLFITLSSGAVLYVLTFLLFFIFFENLRRSKLLKVGYWPNLSLILFFAISFFIYYTSFN